MESTRVTRSSPLPSLRNAGAEFTRAARRALGRAALPQRDGFWLVVRLSGSLDELRTPPSPFGSRPEPSLFELLETLDAAGRDPQVDGVLLRLSGPLHGISRVLSLRRAVAALREAGKPVAVYAETLEAESLLLACAADEVWLPESWYVRLRARAALVFKLNGEVTGSYSNYRRFTTDSTVIHGEATP